MAVSLAPWEWGKNRHGERRLFAADGTVVIGVEDNCTHLRSESHVEVWDESDERLIAAAPEMLKLLREIVAHGMNTDAYRRGVELLFRVEG